MIVENVALQVLRREFTHAIADAQDLAERARQQLQQRAPSEAPEHSTDSCRIIIAFLGTTSQESA